MAGGNVNGVEESRVRNAGRIQGGAVLGTPQEYDVAGDSGCMFWRHV